MYEYLVSAETEQLSTLGFFLTVFFGPLSVVLIMGFIAALLNKEWKDAASVFIFGCVSALIAYWGINHHHPIPEYTTVTATRTDGEFSRQEKSGKHSTTVAGYIPYLIQDGSDLIYYHKITGGSVISENIVLYKVKKAEKQ